MDIRLFLIYVVMFSTMHQCPAVYRDLMCEFTGNEVFCTLLCVLLTLVLGCVPSIAKRAKDRKSTMVTMDLELRNRPPLCRHCGTAPCQVKRSTLWSSSACRKRDKANFAKRSNAMMLFSYVLAFSADLTKELPQDELYWERKSCQYFKEKHMALFPLCIQRKINYWYPVPRIARYIAPTVETKTDG